LLTGLVNQIQNRISELANAAMPQQRHPKLREKSKEMLAELRSVAGSKDEDCDIGTAWTKSNKNWKGQTMHRYPPNGIPAPRV
jgi:hypothetical protein